jgi:nitroreductase
MKAKDRRARGGMMINQVLEAIRHRRSIIRFEKAPIEDEKIEAILEAGRWAPSCLNGQPWRFIVVTDPAIKETLAEFTPSLYKAGMQEAPACIVVAVDPNEEPFHFIEDGAAATQNMALAAYSLGLGSCWVGVFRLEGERGSSEEKIKKVLEIPKSHRVISLLPIGVPKYWDEKKNRKGLSQLVYRNKFTD